MEKENSRLAAQVEELKKRLEELEKVKVVSGAASPSRVGAGVNGERVSVHCCIKYNSTCHANEYMNIFSGKGRHTCLPPGLWAHIHVHVHAKSTCTSIYLTMV